MKTLRVTLADLEGIPHATAAAATAVTVTAAYTGPVILTDGTIIPTAIKAKTVGSSGVVNFSVHAADDPAVREDHQGFAITVTAQIRLANGSVTAFKRTVKPLESMDSTIQLGTLTEAEGLPPQWVTIDEFTDEMDAAVAAAESAQSSASSAASSAAASVTLAQQAQAAALEVPDANVSALIGNPATDTRAALATVLPDRRVEVASMPAWTGDPADDQSAAFAQAAAVHTGPMTIGVPVGTWKAQGLILREGLFYVGQGIEATTLTLPESPTDHLMRSEAHGTIWSGGVLSMTLEGGADVHGVGHPGVNGIDLESYDQCHAFEIRDALIRGFERGVNGSQNGGIGDDRWLVLINTRVWRCYVGVYANEHPQLVGVDIRECHFGVAGRLYDFGMVGGKINRCIVGIGGAADARCTNLNASITAVSFYRNETALVVGSHAKVSDNWIKGGHPNSTRPPGVVVRGVVCDGQFISVTGNRFGTQTFQCDVDVDVISGSASTNRLVDISNNSFVGGGGDSPATHIGCIRAASGGASVNVRANSFNLIGTARGIRLTGGVTAWNITDNQAWITGDGQFLGSANGNIFCAVEGNILYANFGGALSRPLIEFNVASSGVNWYRGNIFRTVAGTIGTLLGVDSRSAHVDANVVGSNCTVVEWGNVGGVGTVQYMGPTNSGPGVEAKAVSNGTGTIASGQTSLTVEHGLPKAPTTVSVTPTRDERLWVTDRNATTFTINREGTSGAHTAAGWIAYAFDQ